VTDGNRKQEFIRPKAHTILTAAIQISHSGIQA